MNRETNATPQEPNNSTELEQQIAERYREREKNLIIGLEVVVDKTGPKFEPVSLDEYADDDKKPKFEPVSLDESDGYNRTPNFKRITLDESADSGKKIPNFRPIGSEE